MVSTFAIPQSAFAITPQKQTTLKNTVVKKAGRVTDTKNSILSGKGAPSSSLGVLGDFYIDTASMNFYGPKTSTKWPTPISLKGPAGPMGPSGIDGKSTSSATNSKAEKGETGLTGLTGATGAAGPKGATGDSGLVGSPGASGPPGATGATGSVGSAGPSGSSGSPGATGSPGAKGDIGVTGDKGTTGSPGSPGSPGAQGNIGSPGAKGDAGITGDKGATGSQGIQGDVGPVGPNGISTASIGSVFFGTLISSGNTEVSSSSFGNFLAKKIYVIELMIHGTFAATEGEGAINLVRITAPGVTPTVIFTYLVSSGASSRNSGSIIENNISARILLDGTAVDIDYKLQVVLLVNPATTSNAFSASGGFLAEQVGGIVPM